MGILRQWLAATAALFWAVAGFAHITPNVELLKKGDFLKENLTAASRFFQVPLAVSGPDAARIEKATGWTPSEEDAQLYVGRDGEGRLVGSAAFVWMPSQHGPIGIAVAFDAEGSILRAAVTDASSESLAWVRPLLSAGGMESFTGLGADVLPDTSLVASGVTGKMSRYYASVIAQGVARAKAMEGAARTARKR